MNNCECGCGKMARVRFVLGHNSRVADAHIGPPIMPGPLNHQWKGGKTKLPIGYILVACPGHPRAGKNNYVYEHVLVAEKALGRYLPDGVEVHHVNEIKHDNRGSNLVICEDQAYHRLLHKRMRTWRRHEVNGQFPKVVMEIETYRVVTP